MFSTPRSGRLLTQLLAFVAAANFVFMALPAAELTVSANADWTYEKAAHLLSRAGFGGTPKQIEFLVSKGRDWSVDYLVDFEKIKLDDPSYPAGEDLPPMAKGGMIAGFNENDRMEILNVVRRIDFGHMEGVREWWLRRMVITPRPFEEKMTLFWHGHFTSGFKDVKNWRMIYDQNELLRSHCVGKFEPFLMAISTDSAMLEFLDNSSNQKNKPNENYARELMELFTMGVNTYTENDIKEAARALTGWRVTKSGGEGTFQSRQHDGGEKEFLGKKGNFELKDIVHIIMERPETSRFLAKKIWMYFGCTDPAPEVIEGLAANLRATDFDLRETMRSLFKCDAFYAAAVLHAQIKNPVELVVGAYRQLEIPPANGKGMYLACQQMGQDLFEPPNVKGWDGGRLWINTSTLFIRNNFGTALMMGNQKGMGLKGPALKRPDAENQEMAMEDEDLVAERFARLVEAKLPGEKFAKVRETIGKLPVPHFYTQPQPAYDPATTLKDYNLQTADDVIQHYIKRLNLIDVAPEQIKILRDMLNGGKAFAPDSAEAPLKIRAAVSLMMTLPAYQLN